jgi:6-pyruvoyl-tetrahydropterin synthase
MNNIDNSTAKYIKSEIEVNEKLFIVSRDICFYAIHNLEERDEHIHKFCVTLSFSGSRKYFSNNFKSSLLINYLDIDKLWKNHVLSALVDSDKRITVKNSTCEILAEWIFDQLLDYRNLFHNCFLHSVKVNDGDVSVEVSQRENL